MKPLVFGPLAIDFPVIQAALSGYSDAPMRKMARRFGAEFTLCEVMLDQFVVAVSKRKSKLYFVDAEEHPCGAQLMGSEPEEFSKAAKRLVNEGFDLIDLNFACPVRKVLGRGRGGYFMSHPTAALEIVDRVRQSIPDHIPLTMKLRKGFDDQPESRDHFFQLLDGAIDRGICGLTLHGRTVRQRYEGVSDWQFLRQVKEYLVNRGRPEISVVGSGDLFVASDCLNKLHASGLDGLALARGVIGNPWLFRELKALMIGSELPPTPSLAEQHAVLADHFRLSEQLYGQSRAASTMRAFGVKYCLLHPQSEQVRAEFVRVKSAEDWMTVLDRWYPTESTGNTNEIER